MLRKDERDAFSRTARLLTHRPRNLGRDPRTIRRFEGTLFWIDKALFGPMVKAQTCRVCAKQFRTSENRNGFCPSCSRAGEGRRGQGRIISERYKGKGNPNFVNGQSKKTFRHVRDGKEWAKEVVARDGACRVCAGEAQLQAHHILPAALFPQHALEVGNGITLCCFHHTELHRQALDLRLLPSLYESKPDALAWHEALDLQDQFQALRSLAARPCRKRELLQVVPRNGQKMLLRLHPEFARRVFGLSASK